MKEIGEIELSIQGGTEEIEALGEAGKVEESMDKLAAVESLKQLKVDKERELQNLNENAGASGHQKLRVCEICGAMLSVLDSDKRLADHFGGKMHLGFHELRKLMTAWAEARMRGPPPSSHQHSHAHMAPTGAPPAYAPPPPAGSRPPVPPFPADGKREAGELVEGPAGSAPRDPRDDRGSSYRSSDRGSGRYDDRDRDRGGSRYDDRDRAGGDRYGDRDRSRYDDRDRRDRNECVETKRKTLGFAIC
jgi:hypothetical protein